MTSVLLPLGGVCLALLLFVLRALAVDEVRGRIRRRLVARLETTIESLPDELQTEWADEWRAELAAVIEIPIAALMFVSGVRGAARELVGELALAPSGAEARTPIGGSSDLRRRLSSAWRAATPRRTYLRQLLGLLSARWNRGFARLSHSLVQLAQPVERSIESSARFVEWIAHRPPSRSVLLVVTSLFGILQVTLLAVEPTMPSFIPIVGLVGGMFAAVIALTKRR
jgi:hypothetical protein